MSLKGKVALVTGSTSGICLGIARALALPGADIMLHRLGDTALIEATRDNLGNESGVEAGYDGAAISEPDQIAVMMEATVETFGSLDILLNNAGI